MAKLSKQEIRTQQIADKIRKLRIENGYSSYENFAWDNNLPVRSYFRMESGTNFTIKNLFIILDIHKVSLHDFFSDID